MSQKNEKRKDIFNYYARVLYQWVSVHVKYNACVSQIRECYMYYHTKSGLSESTVVDERSVGVSSTASTAGCTTNWCPEFSLSNI